MISQILFVCFCLFPYLLCCYFFKVLFALRGKLVYYTSFLKFCQALFSWFFKICFWCIPFDTNFFIIHRFSVFVKYFFQSLQNFFCDVVSSNANLFSIHHFFVFVNVLFQVFDTFWKFVMQLVCLELIYYTPFVIFCQVLFVSRKNTVKCIPHSKRACVLYTLWLFLSSGK